MAQVNFYLKDADAKEASLIYLYFSFDNKRIKVSSGESIKPAHWNSNAQRVKSSVAGSNEVNHALEKLAAEVMKVYRQMKLADEQVTPNAIRNKIDIIKTGKPTKHDFFGFCDSFIASVSHMRTKGTIGIYRNTLANLRAFQEATGAKIDFNTIDLNFYNDFTEYLTRTKLYSINTVAKNIKTIKTFLNEATERGLNTKIDYKSKKFKVVTEDTESIYLSEKEIEKLYKLDLSKNSRLEKVRDLFVVGTWTGLRFSDFSQIRKENIKDGFINIRTQKTDEQISVPIHPMVKSIMNKYDGKYDNSLPPAIANQNMNYYLKEIGQLAGFDDKFVHTRTLGKKRVQETFKKYELLVTHTARRSFATNLYLAGFPAISIMKITGHRTEKAFLRYIKVRPMENAMKLKEFWDKKQ
jgi:integrase